MLDLQNTPADREKHFRTPDQTSEQVVESLAANNQVRSHNPRSDAVWFVNVRLVAPLSLLCRSLSGPCVWAGGWCVCSASFGVLRVLLVAVYNLGGDARRKDELNGRELLRREEVRTIKK